MSRLLVGGLAALGAAEPATAAVRATGPFPLTVRCAGPLGTAQALPGQTPGARRVTVAFTLPPGSAPVGVGAWAADGHGGWYQRFIPGTLGPGAHRLAIDLEPGGARSEPGGIPMQEPDAARCVRTGIILWSTSGAAVELPVEAAVAPLPAAPGPGRLLRLQVQPQARSGERWELACLPDPLPADPYDDGEFSLQLTVTAPDGTATRHAGFWREPQALGDGGDRETWRPAAAGRFAVRWRPARPGQHRLRLEARWRDGRSAACELPPVAVAGAPFDGWLRVDAGDPRFFSVGGAWSWPIGLNLRSPWDSRSHKALNTERNPDRGTWWYREVFDRFAAAGGTACEVWMSSWNLALEWNRAWRGYHGVGRYHQGNAERLDRVLDLAWERGIRVNLVVNNHGQASVRADREWELNPYGVANGGQLAAAEGFFTDPWALDRQDRLRRYLVARYGDHPGVMAWKLWSEVNLTVAEQRAGPWHEQAAARWRALDPYRHPLTTHWAGDWRSIDRQVAQLPGIDFLCIDAYHDRGALAPLLHDSARRGFGQYRKPGLVTEYGANWSGGSDPLLTAEHASAGWCALVAGHAGSPMNWWHEWVEQRGGWKPYQALARFLAGEDLRGAEARSALLACEGASGLSARAWIRPGRILAHVLDLGWQEQGGEGGMRTGAQLVVGEQVAAGRVQLEWWDADEGTVRRRAQLAHPGGRLAVPVPEFRRQLMLKLWRAGEAGGAAPVVPETTPAVKLGS